MIRLKPLFAPFLCSWFGHKPTSRQDMERGPVDQCSRCEKELTPEERAEGTEPAESSALALKEVVEMGGDMSFGSRIEIPVQEVRTYQKRIEVKVLSKRRRATK